VLCAVDEALRQAGPGELVVLALHHHPLPLPAENLPERVASRLGWPWVGELARGRSLLSRVTGRADLVLHGHRHVPRALSIAPGRRPLTVYNAGSSTELGGFRVFRHVDGALAGPPAWHDVQDTAARFRTTLRAAGAA
jgi:hypothetical protein